MYIGLNYLFVNSSIGRRRLDKWWNELCWPSGLWSLTCDILSIYPQQHLLRQHVSSATKKKNKGQNVFKVMENWPLWQIILVHAESALLITWRNLFAFKDCLNKNSGRSSRPRIKMNVPELIKVSKNSFTWLVFQTDSFPKSPLTRPGRRRFLIAAFTCTATSSTVLSGIRYNSCSIYYE